MHHAQHPGEEIFIKSIYDCFFYITKTCHHHHHHDAGARHNAGALAAYVRITILFITLGPPRSHTRTDKKKNAHIFSQFCFSAKSSTLSSSAPFRNSSALYLTTFMDGIRRQSARVKEMWQIDNKTHTPI